MLDVLEMFIVTALMLLPFAFPCGLFCFLAARWGLRRKNKIIRQIIKTGLLLFLAILAAGTIYGILRFSGIIMFADDKSMSYHWLGCSWRDDGFDYIYKFGMIFAGAAAAFLPEKRSGKTAKTALESNHN